MSTKLSICGGSLSLCRAASSGGQRALQNIERQSNPWGFSQKDRFKWKHDFVDLHVPTVHENPDFEIVYFIGSMGSYDARSNKVTRSFVQLLNKAQVNYAVLGEEEKKFRRYATPAGQ